MNTRHAWPGVVFALGLAGCPDKHSPAPAVEIDNLRTVSALIGGDPIISATLLHCSGNPPVVVYANGIEVSREPAVFPFSVAEEEMVYPAGTRLFQLAILGSQLSPAQFGLPAVFDLELEVKCGARWIRSAPFSMMYVPTQASILPPFNPTRFWVSDALGDLLACEDTRLVRFIGGTTRAEELELGFACGVTQMSDGLGGRRYLWGDSLGLAAIDPGPSLAWSRPMDLIDVWTDPGRDPVVLRTEGMDPVLEVLDRATGEVRVGPLTLLRRPLGPLVRNAANDIFVLETEVTADPASRLYAIQRFDSAGQDLGSTVATVYLWQAPPYLARFDQAGTALYVLAAPNNADEAWIEKIDVTTGGLLWSTAPEAGWRHPLAEAAGRLAVASNDSLVWLDPDTGEVASVPFAPDSGKSFLWAVVEQDGSLVMLADATGNVATGLYMFAPDGSLSLRFRPGSAMFRWLTPGWLSGTLVSFFDEVHFLYPRADYDAMLAP